MQTNPAKAIIDTLSYFSLFSYPLTPQELRRYAWGMEINDQTLQQTLADLIEKEVVHMVSGYITFSESDESVGIRQHRWWLAHERLMIAQKAARKLRVIPFLDAIFVCNQLPITAKESSDIDVFIVARRDRLWIVRLLATLWLSMWGMRRHGKHIKKHVCLSFYCTSSALDLSKIAIDGDDVYLAYWLDTLIPVYDSHHTYKKIIQENEWAKKYIPLFGKPPIIDQYSMPENIWSRGIKKFFEIAWQGRYGSFINDQAKKIQQQKMKQTFHSTSEHGGRHVIVSDAMLKFHENDRRAQFQQRWNDIRKKYVELLG